MIATRMACDNAADIEAKLCKCEAARYLYAQGGVNNLSSRTRCVIGGAAKRSLGRLPAPATILAIYALILHEMSE
jgi:hypothetical protein